MDIRDRGKAERWLARVVPVGHALQEFSRIRRLRAAAREVHAAPSGIAAADTEFKSSRSRSREDYSVESGQIDGWTAGRKRESEPGVAKVY
jgi:hypothetical protein